MVQSSLVQKLRNISQTSGFSFWRNYALAKNANFRHSCWPFFKEHLSEKFRLLDDEEGKQADILKRNNYFMTSGDKVRFFFDPMAYDHDENLVDGNF